MLNEKNDANTLAAKLRALYVGAPNGEKKAYITSFGIMFSNELDSCGATARNIRAVALEGFELKAETFVAEINQGKKLSKYVNLKDKHRAELEEILKQAGLMQST